MIELIFWSVGIIFLMIILAIGFNLLRVNRKIKSLLHKDGKKVFGNVDSYVSPFRYQAEHSYYAGVILGAFNEPAALTIIDATTREQVWTEYRRVQTIDEIYEWLQDRCSQWKPDCINVEANGPGMAVIDLLKQRGLKIKAFFFNQKNKAFLIENLAIALKRGYLSLLDNPVQAKELSAYQVEVTETGLKRYHTPPGTVDNLVLALALAFYPVNYRTAPRTLTV